MINLNFLKLLNTWEGDVDFDLWCLNDFKNWGNTIARWSMTLLMLHLASVLSMAYESNRRWSCRYGTSVLRSTSKVALLLGFNMDCKWSWSTHHSLSNSDEWVGRGGSSLSISSNGCSFLLKTFVGGGRSISSSISLRSLLPLIASQVGWHVS